MLTLFVLKSKFLFWGVVMYETYCKLRDSRGCKDSDVAKTTGITKSTFSDWKNGRSEPKIDKLQKIADYFEVSVDWLLGKTDIKSVVTTENEFSAKDEKDIAKTMDALLRQLENEQDALLFDGEPLDDESKELLKISLENSVRIAKKLAEEKYTPKKYR